MVTIKKNCRLAQIKGALRKDEAHKTGGGRTAHREINKNTKEKTVRRGGEPSLSKKRRENFVKTHGIGLSNRKKVTATPFAKEEERWLGHRSKKKQKTTPKSSEEK